MDLDVVFDKSEDVAEGLENSYNSGTIWFAEDLISTSFPDTSVTVISYYYSVSYVL